MSLEQKNLNVQSVPTKGNSRIPVIASISNSIELYDAIMANEENDNFKSAIRVIEQCIQNGGIESVALSFNGGKDCTVVLHLIRAVLAKLDIPFDKLLTIYFFNEHDFPELQSFMKDILKEYGFQLREVNNGGFKEGIEMLLKENPKIKYFYMGQRRNDPHAKNLTEINLSDVHKGWPEFYRVNPILEWGYRDVWTFLKGFQLPYCSLYDQGYTSLGNHHTSSPNAALQAGDSFLPAYLLTDENKERSGRMSNAGK